MRLSELPGFLPLGKPGSPERRACALGTFTNHEANVDFMRYLRRIAVERRLARAASAAPYQPTPVPAAALEGLTSGR